MLSLSVTTGVFGTCAIRSNVSVWYRARGLYRMCAERGGAFRSEAENGLRSEGQKRLQRSPVGGSDAEYATSPGETEQQFEQ